MPNAKEKVLVTGAAGFIGSRVANALVQKGHRVIATDVSMPHAGAAGYEFYTADIRDITRHAPVIARDCGSIVHCGGISGPMLLQDNPAEVLDINIRGTSQLLSVAKAAGIRRFVNLSSVSAYGHTPGHDLVEETAPLSASTFYGSSKAATDLIVQTYAGNLGLSAISLRIGWVYGPGRRTDALVQPIVRSAKGDPYHLASGAAHRLQFVHVEDVVAAILCALSVGQPHRTAYNINGAEVVTIGEMLDLIARQLPSIRARIGAGLLPDTEVQGTMSLKAARDDLGWTPEIPFIDGLWSYVSWLQDHPF